MDILDFTYDLEKRTKGVKVPLGKDAYLLIAESETPEFWEVHRTIRESVASPEDDLTLEQQQDVLCRTFAECVLLGWEGLTENGEPVEYSKEKAVEWLSAKDKERFFNKVYAESKKFANFKAERLEKEKKP